MSIETLEAPDVYQTDKDFFTPETAADFQRLVETELGKTLVEVDEDEVSTASVLWRGHNAREVVGLLEGRVPAIELHSEKPNVTLDWHKAIAYNRGGEGLKYNMVMGFLPPDDWDSRPAQETVSEDLLKFRDVAEYQQGNFVGNGTVAKQDLRYVIIRAHGDPGKDVGPCHFYKIAA